MRLAISASIFIIMSLALSHAALSVTKDGVYQDELKVGHVNSSKIANVISVRDDLVSININNQQVLLKEGETHDLKSKRSLYEGTVELIEVNDDSVVIQADIQSTSKLYMSIIPQILLFSAVISIIIIVDGKRSK